jgi:hypothetical protein
MGRLPEFVRYFLHTVMNVLSLHLPAEKLMANTDYTKLHAFAS